MSIADLRTRFEKTEKELAAFQQAKEVARLNCLPSVNIDFQEALNKAKAEFNELAPCIRAKYGDWLSDYEVHEIISAQKENAVCAKCNGQPCSKNHNRNYLRVIRIAEDAQYLSIALAPCKYEMQTRRQKKIQRNFVRCKIPPKYVGKTFADYEVTRGNEVAVEWAKYAANNPEQGLMLYGEPGCGKTFLAAILAQEHLQRGRTVIFGDVPSILDAMKSTFDSGDANSTLEKLMDELESVDVLVLDDVGTEYPTNWAAERLYIIVNQRYNAEKPIIVTSNFDAVELTRRFRENVTGKRIVSRISEMCKVIRISDGDRRLIRYW